MKRLILSVVASLAFVGACAAEGPWLTDYSAALTKAKQEGKLVLLDFTGSDWCPPCKALHKNVLSTDEFLEFAKKNLVLVELDFPRKKPQSAELKKANRELAEKFEIEGYPTIIILDGAGKQLSKDVGYRGEDAKRFMAKIEKLRKK
jgi:thioredoxin-related protein